MSHFVKSTAKNVMGTVQCPTCRPPSLSAAARNIAVASLTSTGYSRNYKWFLPLVDGLSNCRALHDRRSVLLFVTGELQGGFMLCKQQCAQLTARPFLFLDKVVPLSRDLATRMSKKDKNICASIAVSDV